MLCCRRRNGGSAGGQIRRRRDTARSKGLRIDRLQLAHWCWNVQQVRSKGRAIENPCATCDSREVPNIMLAESRAKTANGRIYLTAWSPAKLLQRGACSVMRLTACMPVKTSRVRQQIANGQQEVSRAAEVGGKRQSDQREESPRGTRSATRKGLCATASRRLCSILPRRVTSHGL